MLVARYTLRAHRAAFLLGAGEESDDVVQEAFVKAFRHLSRFRAGEPFAPWLLRIVANETRNLTRSRRRRTALALRLSAAVPSGSVRHSRRASASRRRRERVRFLVSLATMRSSHGPNGSPARNLDRCWNAFTNASCTASSASAPAPSKNAARCARSVYLATSAP